MTNNNNTRLVKVNNLTKSFKGAERPAVADISFSLDKGEVLGILGPNGAGKTTTIKMVLGLIIPTSGSTTVLGHDMAIDNQRRIANPHIGAVLEGARNIYWRLSPIENLRYFAANRGFHWRDIKTRAYELLDLLDLSKQADKLVLRFSQGMKQKVALANALVHDPDILLLDEPTLGLDLETAQRIEGVISQMVKQGKGVILTTHQMQLAERLTSKILVINQGKEVAHNETQVLLNRFDRRAIVEIKVEGSLSDGKLIQIKKLFPAITAKEEKRLTLLEWTEPSQQQILALLNMIDQMGHKVHNLNHREPSLEEVFLSLTTRSK